MSCKPHAGETFGGRRKETSLETIFDTEAAIVPERKWKDVPETVAANTNLINRELLNVVLLNGLAQGDGQNQRKGKVVRWTNISIRGIIEGNMDSVGVCDPSLITIWLIYDKQFNGALPSATDILQYGVGPTIPAQASYNPSSQFLNMANSERFVVLKRYTKAFAPWEKASGQLGYAGSPSVDQIDWSFDVDLETIYSGQAVGVGNLRSGAILLCSTGDVAPFVGGNNNDWKFVYHCRLRYIDP